MYNNSHFLRNEMRRIHLKSGSILIHLIQFLTNDRIDFFFRPKYSIYLFTYIFMKLNEIRLTVLIKFDYHQIFVAAKMIRENCHIATQKEMKNGWCFQKMALI